MRSSRFTAGLAALATLALSVVFVPAAHAVDTESAVVISEVYGGGGNGGGSSNPAPYNEDFIELFNHGNSSVDVTGWSVQYGSSGGSTWKATPLTGSIAPGAFYLVGEAFGAGTGAPLPTPDVTDDPGIAMSGTNGKVALVDGSTALGCGTSCSGAASVVDFVGYGSANDAAGTPTPALSNSTSAQRQTDPFANTGNNNADFVIASPTPKAATSGVPTGPDCSANPLPDECKPGPDTIQDVQGDGFISPLDDQTVSNVPGIVTAVRTSGSRGFWIQESDPDTSDTSASSGLFVYTSSAPVSAGDSVLVSGTVSDFYTLSFGETVANTASLSVTEIDPTTVTVASKDNPLPAALQLTPTTVPDRYAPTVAGGNIESIDPVDPANSALEFWEAHEGMRVEVDDARVVGPGKTQYGEIYVTTKPDQQVTPRGGTYIASYEATPSGRLLVTPVNGSVPPANVGDELVGATAGPVDWSTFGGYDIAATEVGSYRDNGLTPNVATAQADDQLAIATYNVENLAADDPQSKFDELGAGVVDDLASPDIVSLEEIQDNNGATDDGTVVADQTLAKLTAAIVAAGGPSYQSAQIDPVNDQDGGEPGGNIRVAFLYNPDRVTFVARPGGDSTTAVTVSQGTDGTPELSTSPGRVDPTNDAWTDSRKPLAGEFVFDGQKVIVVANHFDSKGGDQSADGRFQPPTRSSEIQRNKQATVLNGFVHQVLDADPNANIVLAGDFNDYQFSQPIKTLTEDGAVLTDLINTLPVNERYTYNFDGVSQVLDHIFVSKALTDVEYDVVHLNSEFAAQASDHDPQVVRIRPAVPTPPSTDGTIKLAPPKVRAGKSVNVHLDRFDPGSALTVALDGTTQATVTTDKRGSAKVKVTVPSDTADGMHTVTATTPDGATVSAPLEVTASRGSGHGPGHGHGPRGAAASTS